MKGLVSGLSFKEFRRRSKYILLVDGIRMKLGGAWDLATIVAVAENFHLGISCELIPNLLAETAASNGQMV